LNFTDSGHSFSARAYPLKYQGKIFRKTVRSFHTSRGVCEKVWVAVALRNTGVDDNQHLTFYDFEREDFKYPEVVSGLGCGEDQVDWMPGLEDCFVLDIGYLHAVDFALAALPDQCFEHLNGCSFFALSCNSLLSFCGFRFPFGLGCGML
jgi:hypothetical protein